MSGQKGKVHLGPNVSSSAHDRGCVVNGSGAMAAICVLLLLNNYRFFVCFSLSKFHVDIYCHTSGYTK